jgi:hypothetical protein
MRDRMAAALTAALGDLAILGGMTGMPENGVTWQDVAGTAAVNLEVLAKTLREVRERYTIDVYLRHLVFPNVEECLHAVAEEFGIALKGKEN